MYFYFIWILSTVLETFTELLHFLFSACLRLMKWLWRLTWVLCEIRNRGLNILYSLERGVCCVCAYVYSHYSPILPSDYLGDSGGLRRSVSLRPMRSLVLTVCAIQRVLVSQNQPLCGCWIHHTARGIDFRAALGFYLFNSDLICVRWLLV
jgi:hypothetical protein